MDSIIDRIAKWPGPTSLEEGYNFCGQLCRTYSEADAEVRDAIRKAVASNENVRGSLLYNTTSEVGPGGFLVETARRAHEAGDYLSYLRRALLAISMTDGFDDSRDTLMWLAEQWREAEAQSVDPAPLYEEIGNISSTEPIHMIGGPTAGMILQMLDERRREQLKWS